VRSSHHAVQHRLRSPPGTAPHEGSLTVAFYPTSNPPCRHCGSTRTAKAVYTKGSGPTLVVRIACENVAPCKVRAAKSKGA